MKSFIKNYRHGFYLLYFLVYLVGFTYLERQVTTKFNVIQSTLDNHIPFCEYFIVPYMLWFFFIGITIMYFFFQKNHKEYYQYITFLYFGMTIFLIICAVYPNGHYLRPKTFANNTIFTQLVQNLYRIDTSTNVLPSIHVYNTLGAWIAIRKSAKLRNYKFLQLATSLLSLSIILSTMFLKQHSVIDVLCAFLIGAVAYVIIYHPQTATESELPQSKEIILK